MAIAFVNETHANWTAGSSISLPAQSHTTGNLILVAVGTDSNLDVSSVTDTAGNTYQAAYTGVRQGANNWCTLWYAKNITGNAGNVVVIHLTGTPGTGRAGALQYSGVDTASPIDESPGGNYQSSTSTPSLPAWIPGTSAEAIVVASYINPSKTWTVDANYALRAFGGAGTTFCLQDRLNAPGTSQSWQDTLSSSTSFAASCGVGLIPGAAPPADPNLPYVSTGFPLHVVSDTGPGGSSFSVTTGTYSVNPNSILVAFTASDWSGSTVSMSNPTMGSGSIAWTQIQSDNTQGTVGTITAWKGIATAGGCTGVTTRAVFSTGNIGHLYVCAFENGQISDVGASAKAIATTSSAPFVNLNPNGASSSLLVAFGWNPGSGTGRVLRLGEWVDASQLHVWVQKYACTDSTTKAMGLTSPSYGNWGMAAVEILAISSVVWPQQYSGQSNARFMQLPLMSRSGVFAPVGGQAELVVAPRLVPQFYGPASFTRPQWNPPRSFTAYINSFPNFDIGFPIQPCLPSSFLRNAWNPERTVAGMPRPPNELVAVQAPCPPEMYGPDRHMRPAWNPPRSQAWQDVFPRLPWNADGRYGAPWRPMLPERQPRPSWVPTRTFTYQPVGIAAAYTVRAPSVVYFGKAFTCYVEVVNSGSADNLMVIDVQPYFLQDSLSPQTGGYFSSVSVPDRASLPTILSALYSASGWVRVDAGASVTFAFDCVCDKIGTAYIGARLGVAVVNDLARVNQTVRNPSNKIAEPAVVTVRSVTG